MHKQATSVATTANQGQMSAISRAAGHILCPDVTKPIHDLHITDVAPREPRWLQLLLLVLVVVYVMVRIVECCAKLG